MDELDGRVRSLRAERQRPEPSQFQRPLRAETSALLDELIHTLAQLFKKDD